MYFIYYIIAYYFIIYSNTITMERKKFKLIKKFILTYIYFIDIQTDNGEAIFLNI